MHWKMTLVLVVLAGAAGLWLWKGDEWGPRIGLSAAHSERPPSEAVRVVDSFTPAGLTRIEIAFPSGDPLVLERPDAASEWKLPGNWPARKNEVDELTETLGTLRTRFQAIPAIDADLAAYGLTPAQNPLRVTLVVRGAKHALLFGEPNLAGDETAFTRPSFVRVDDQPEVLRLGPDVMPVLRRSAESYRRRALFPDVERVKVAAGSTPPSPFAPPSGDAPVALALPGEDTEKISVSRPAPSVLGFRLLPAEGEFALVRRGKLPEPAAQTRGGEPALNPDRLADAWELILPVHSRDGFPYRDNCDPGKLRALLAAVADLWVEEFVNPPPPEDKLGFAVTGQAISVKRKGADPVTVRFGAVGKTGEREETVSVPPVGPPGSPPRNVTRKVPVEYRYARLDGSPQVFLVAADKLPDLFPAVGEMVDSRVARFSADEVWEVVVRSAGRPEVKLTRKKGNPKATNPDDRSDRWLLDARPNALPADTGRVNELLDQLSGLRAAKSDARRYEFDAAKLGLNGPRAVSVRVVAREVRPEGEPEAPAREYDIVLGAADPLKHLLPVEIAGRVSLVDDKRGGDDPDSWVGAWLFPRTVSEMIARPPVTYRGRKLFDTADTSLEAVTVAGGFALKKEGDEWKLTAPLTSEADPGKAAQLASTLSALSATEFLTESPTADELATFGLDKPAQTITLGFTKGRTYTLELGAPRPGKGEVFARLDRGGVFALPNTVTEQLTTGAVGLLPLKVWSATPEKITAVEIARTGDAKDSFTLTKDGTNWKLTGPFTAPVPFLDAQPFLTALGNLTAVKYQSLTAANPAEFGFDKPLLTIKLAAAEKKPTGEEAPVSRTAVIGGPTADGVNRYARLDAPNAPVFVVPAAFVTAAQTPPLDLLDKSLLLLDPRRITKVQVAPEKAEDTFTLTKDDKGKWAAEGISFAVDPERIAQLTGSAGRLPVVRIAGYGDAVKWADFGLDKPEGTVTVTLGGDKPELHTVALGKTDPTGGRFARVDNGPAVAVLAAPAAEALTRKKFEYADRTLLTFDPTAVTGLTRTQGKDELELAPGAAVGWDVVKPAKQKADGEFVDELAGTLGRLRAERVAAYGKRDEMYKQFGLEPAAAVVALTVGDKAEEKRLRIGNPVDPARPDGERYAAVESASPEVIVGVLPAALAAKLLAPPVAFRDHALAKFVDADKAVLERGDRKVTFAKVGVTWKVTEPLAAAAESAELEALVADLGKLRVETWVAEKGADPKPFGLDRPEAKWTLSDGDKPVLVLLVGKKTADGRVYVAAEKGELVGLLDPGMTARVLAEYRQRRPWDMDAAQVESVDIAATGSKFSLDKSGPLWTDPAKPTDPIDVRAVNELLGTLGALRVERYAADKDADPKLFGLEKPEVTLTVSTPSGRRVLEIGGPVGGTDGKQRYARVADKDRTDVFVLTAADTARLTRDRGEYVMKK